MEQIINKYALDVVSTAVPTADATDLCGDVLNHLMQQQDLVEIDSIYVLDETKQCIGFITLQALFHAKKNSRVEDLINPNVISVPSDATLRQAVHMALEHKLHEIPVTDHDGVFLGIIRSRDVLAATYQELTSNLFKSRGIEQPVAGYDDILHLSILRSIRHRLPWLLIGIIGGLFSTVIVNHFEETLARTVLLAAFIPLVVYMADAVGAQVQAYAIRDLTRYKKPPLGYAVRQTTIVFLLSLIIAAVIFCGSFLLYQNLIISIVVACSLIGAITLSAMTGLGLPYFFRTIHQDPANASGPVGEIIQNILSIVVFFIVATTFIQ